MIRIFVTGGTFDKRYDELRGALTFGDTHLPEMLRLGRSRVEVDVRTLMMIDSLDMSDANRASIVAACRDAKELRILITHGTDTMVETARALGESIGSGTARERDATSGAEQTRAASDGPGMSGAHKTIVLTGAMVPYAFGSSDGLFNLGSALSFVQVLPPGVYVAMNGRCFFWDKVRKNRQSGFFEAI